MDKQPEIWRAIAGFEGAYEVSDLGRVRSLDRSVECATKLGNRQIKVLKGRILSAKPLPYPSVMLSLDNKPIRRRVHVLVADAFLGPRPEGLDVCHNNGVKTDNRASNLRYDTAAANSADAQDQGSFMRGDAHVNAKIGPIMVIAIRQLAKSYKHSTLADMTGLSQTVVSDIIARRAWKHIDPLDGEITPEELAQLRRERAATAISRTIRNKQAHGVHRQRDANGRYTTVTEQTE